MSPAFLAKNWPEELFGPASLYWLLFFFFCQLHTTQSHPERGIFKQRVPWITLASDHVWKWLSWLTADVGRPNILWMMTSSPDRWAWAIEEGYLRCKAGKQPVGKVSASVLARVLSWLPTFNGLYGLEVYGEINPFLPKSLLMVVFITAAEKPTRTGILLKVTRLFIPEWALPIPGRKEVCRKEPRRSWTAKPYWVFTLYITVRSYHFYWVGFPYRCSCFIKPTHEIDQINLLELYSTSSRSIWVSLNNNSNTTPTSNVIIKLSA